ncbi:MAG: 2-hydroxyacyl-CoA dehydratase [Methylocystaceae bacterium]
MVKEYNVDGVIYFNMQFCNLYHRKVLGQSGVSMPFLHLETDYSKQHRE